MKGIARKIWSFSIVLFDAFIDRSREHINKRIAETQPGLNSNRLLNRGLPASPCATAGASHVGTRSGAASGASTIDGYGAQSEPVRQGYRIVVQKQVIC